MCTLHPPIVSWGMLLVCCLELACSCVVVATLDALKAELLNPLQVQGVLVELCSSTAVVDVVTPRESWLGAGQALCVVDCQ